MTAVVGRKILALVVAAVAVVMSAEHKREVAVEVGIPVEADFVDVVAVHRLRS